MSGPTSDGAPLTVVLVHGAFADASSWNGVIERLQAAGLKVTAPANPLRGVSHDSAYIAGFLKRIPGPVLAVGHSYAGAVISNAASKAGNVVGLVFVAAFAPEEGERLGEVEGGSKDSVLNSALVPLKYPVGDGEETAVEFAIHPEKLHDAFAADLPTEQAALMAATQRPVVELAFSEPSGPPAWKSLPSWAVVATGDNAAGTDVTRSMAERAGATITEAEGSPVIMISRRGDLGRCSSRRRARRRRGPLAMAATSPTVDLPELDGIEVPFHNDGSGTDASDRCAEVGDAATVVHDG